MKEFFINYWREIIWILSAVISLVCLFIRKKPVKVVDTVREVIIRLLPYCISQAEKLINATGADKKEYALSLLWKLLSEIVSVSSEDLSSMYSEFASDEVEVILSTPQKKGVI